MRNIAIIPARSGSKGLKNKNIKLINGRPLMWYSIQVAIDSGCFDEVMVSTDSELYAEIARECGASVPFLRSVFQSGDNADSWDVVREVLMNYKRQGRVFDTVCLLQPTSPLRCARDIIESYRVLEQSKGNAVTSVSEVDHSPVWAMILEDDKSLASFREKMKAVPRQQLHQYYRLNGAIYIRRISDNMDIMEIPEYAYIMDKNRSIDIDCELDFRIAEFLMNQEESEDE